MQAEPASAYPVYLLPISVAEEKSRIHRKELISMTLNQALGLYIATRKDKILVAEEISMKGCTENQVRIEKEGYPDFFKLELDDMNTIKYSYRTTLTKFRHAYKCDKLLQLLNWSTSEAKNIGKIDSSKQQKESFQKNSINHNGHFNWYYLKHHPSHSGQIENQDILEIEIEDTELWIDERLFRVSRENNSTITSLHNTHEFSPELSRTLHAYEEFWSKAKVKIEDPDTYPTTREIIAFLVKDNIIPQRRAEEIAKLIKPDLLQQRPIR